MGLLPIPLFHPISSPDFLRCLDRFGVTLDDRIVPLTLAMRGLSGACKVGVEVRCNMPTYNEGKDRQMPELCSCIAPH